MNLIDHLPSLGGLALGVLHHGGNALGGWLQERVKSGEIDKVEEATVRNASYHAWITHTVILVLISAMVWYDHTGNPLMATFQVWSGYGIAWFFGNLWKGR